MAAKKSDTVKVQLRYPTVGRKAGDVIEVGKAEAEALIRNGNALSADDAAKKLQAEIYGTAPEPNEG